MVVCLTLGSRGTDEMAPRKFGHTDSAPPHDLASQVLEYWLLNAETPPYRGRLFG